LLKAADKLNTPLVGINLYARKKPGARNENILARATAINDFFISAVFPAKTIAAVSIIRVKNIANGSTFKGLTVTQCHDELAFETTGSINIYRLVRKKTVATFFFKSTTSVELSNLYKFLLL